MKQRLLEQNVIYADENLVMVLKENGKSATSESRMCVGDEQSKMPVWIFEYQPDRNGKRQESFLRGFTVSLV